MSVGCFISYCKRWRLNHKQREKREKIDISEYTIEYQKDATLGRLPGQVKGNMFIINNNENCNIYVFDNINTVTVDDCVNCNIFLGPIETSVYIRDCKNCKFVIACQQFRTRDCSKIDIFLCCNTQPIIEASSGMKFACFQYYYPELEEQFKSSKMSIFNNLWSSIYDFSQDPDERHFSLLPVESKVEDFVPVPLAEIFSAMQIDLDPSKSVVPVTLGKRRKTSDESCLIIFFNDGNSHDRVVRFLATMRNKNPGLQLVQTNEITMVPSDAERVFGTDAYSSVVQQGPVIGLEYNGENSIEMVQATIAEFMQGTTGLVFVTQNPSQVDSQIENFYNFADMRMAV